MAIKLSKSSHRQIVRLYFRAVADLGPYSASRSSQKMFAEQITNRLKRAQCDGIIEVFEDAGRVRAVYLLYKDNSKLAGKVLAGTLFCESKKPQQWIAKMVRKYKSKYSERMHFWLPASHSYLFPLLERSGLFPCDIILSGSVDKSLKRLKRKYPFLDGNAPEGFKFEAVKSHAQIKTLLRIYRSEFSRNPQFGWFCASPAFQKLVKSECMASMKSKKPCEFVMTKNGKIVGHLGCPGNTYIPYARARKASFGFCFEQSVQGNGFAKYYYFFLLTLLKKRGIQLYQGGTAQRPILKLGKVMGRQPVGYMLNGKKIFDYRYFRI